MPPRYGIVVGNGSAFTTIIYQIHFLAPPGKDTLEQLLQRQYVDSSMMFLHLSRRTHEHSVGVFTWHDQGRRTGAVQQPMLAIPPTTGAELFEYVSLCDPACMLQTKFGWDLQTFGAVRLVSAKLHAHSHARRMRLVHITPRGRRIDMLTLDPFCGYGECQQFHNLPASLEPLRPGSSLELHCWFANPGPAATTIHYGVTNDGEMCAKILMYTPTDTTRRYSSSSSGTKTTTTTTKKKSKSGVTWDDFG